MDRPPGARPALADLPANMEGQAAAHCPHEASPQAPQAAAPAQGNVTPPPGQVRFMAGNAPPPPSARPKARARSPAAMAGLASGFPLPAPPLPYANPNEPAPGAPLAPAPVVGQPASGLLYGMGVVDPALRLPTKGAFGSSYTGGFGETGAGLLDPLFGAGFVPPSAMLPAGGEGAGLNPRSLPQGPAPRRPGRARPRKGFGSKRCVMCANQQPVAQDDYTLGVDATDLKPGGAVHVTLIKLPEDNGRPALRDLRVTLQVDFSHQTERFESYATAGRKIHPQSRTTSVQVATRPGAKHKQVAKRARVFQRNDVTRTARVCLWTKDGLLLHAHPGTLVFQAAKKEAVRYADQDAEPALVAAPAVGTTPVRPRGFLAATSSEAMPPAAASASPQPGFMEQGATMVTDHHGHSHLPQPMTAAPAATAHFGLGTAEPATGAQFETPHLMQGCFGPPQASLDPRAQATAAFSSHAMLPAGAVTQTPPRYGHPTRGPTDPMAPQAGFYYPHPQMKAAAAALSPFQAMQQQFEVYTSGPSPHGASPGPTHCGPAQAPAADRRRRVSVTYDVTSLNDNEIARIQETLATVAPDAQFSGFGWCCLEIHLTVPDGWTEKQTRERWTEVVHQLDGHLQKKDYTICFKPESEAPRVFVPLQAFEQPGGRIGSVPVVVFFKAGETDITGATFDLQDRLACTPWCTSWRQGDAALEDVLLVDVDVDQRVAQLELVLSDEMPLTLVAKLLGHLRSLCGQNMVLGCLKSEAWCTGHGFRGADLARLHQYFGGTRREATAETASMVISQLPAPAEAKATAPTGETAAAATDNVPAAVPPADAPPAAPAPSDDHEDTRSASPKPCTLRLGVLARRGGLRVFLGRANSANNPVRLDEEDRIIQDAIRRHVPDADIRSMSLDSLSDLDGQLARFKPHVFWFLGHGKHDGLAFPDPATPGDTAAPSDVACLEPEATTITAAHQAAVIARIFQLHPCIVAGFNACRSADVAQAVCSAGGAHVAIGTDSLVVDSDALSFSAGFWGSVFEATVGEAFQRGNKGRHATRQIHCPSYHIFTHGDPPTVLSISDLVTRLRLRSETLHKKKRLHNPFFVAPHVASAPTNQPEETLTAFWQAHLIDPLSQPELPPGGPWAQQGVAIALYGCPGAGKSTCLVTLEENLWTNIATLRIIPFYVALVTLAQPDGDGVAAWVRSQIPVDDAGLAELRRSYSIVLLLDGYDEIQRPHNLLSDDVLLLSDAVVISSRLESLVDLQRAHAKHTFEERFLCGFSEPQVEAYLGMRLRKAEGPPLHTVMRRARKTPGLMDLITTPLILNMVTHLIPELVLDKRSKGSRGPSTSSAPTAPMSPTSSPGSARSTPTTARRGLPPIPQPPPRARPLTPVSRPPSPGPERPPANRNPDAATTVRRPTTTVVTRLRLFEEFASKWFGREFERFVEALAPASKTWRRRMSRVKDNDLQQQFAERIALVMFQNSKMTIHIDELDGQEEELLATVFDPSAKVDDIDVLRRACPLRPVGDDSYQFAHRSFFEYLYAKQLLDVGAHGLSPEQQDEKLMELLKGRHIQEEPSVLLFLHDAWADLDPARQAHVQSFHDALFRLIPASARDPDFPSVVSANAATVLNWTCQLSGRSGWQGAKLAGADLSHSVLAHLDLSGADLTGVDLRQSVLYHTNLSGANLTGVQFGQLPQIPCKSAAWCVTYSPDGKLLAIGLQFGGMLLWSVEEQKCIGEFKGDNRRVRSVSFSPDGATIASASDDICWHLWDVHTRRQIAKFEGHTDWILSVCFSPDGKHVATASDDRTCRVWNVDDPDYPGIVLEGHTSGVRTVSFSPDGQLLATGSGDKTVRLWHTDAYEPACPPLEGHTGSVRCVRFSPDGKVLASGAFDGTCRLWSVATQQPLGQPLEGHSDCLWAMAFSPDGRRLATASTDRTCLLWDVATQEHTGQTLVGHTSDILSVAFSPDGLHLTTGSRDKTCRQWVIHAQQSIVQPLTSHSAKVSSIAFNRDGTRLATGSEDNTVCIWNLERLKIIGSPRHGHTKRVRSLAFSPDSTTVASGSDDWSCRLWSVLPRGPTPDDADCLIGGHTDSVVSLAFSPDGRHLASGSDDRSCLLWDVDARCPLGEPMRGHTGWIRTVAFSPDGKLLASGSRDRTCRLWDVNTRRLVGKPLVGHTSWVIRVAFEGVHGDVLATGSHDGSCRLWATETQEHLERIETPTGYWPSTGFTFESLQRGVGSSLKWVSGVTKAARCGDKLAFGDEDGRICLFDTTGGEDGEPRLISVFRSSSTPGAVVLGLDTTGCIGLSPANAMWLEQTRKGQGGSQCEVSY